MKAPKPRSAARKLLDLISEIEDGVERHSDFEEYYSFLSEAPDPHFQIEVDTEYLAEATRATVGRYIARRDPPHFAGDEYHGQCDVGDGHKVGWSVSGKRRHPSKFPANVPRDAKQAVANVLKISVDLLESYWLEEAGRKALLFTIASAA